MNWIRVRAQKFLKWFEGYDGIPYDNVSAYDGDYSKTSIADGYYEGFRDGRLLGRREILNKINKGNKKQSTTTNKEQKRKSRR